MVYTSLLLLRPRTFCHFPQAIAITDLYPPKDHSHLRTTFDCQSPIADRRRGKIAAVGVV